MKFVRCVCTTKDGSRCGRMAPADTQVCAIHARQTAKGIAQPAERTPAEILKKLMADADPAIRLRAVNAWLDYEAKKEGKGCPACEARRESLDATDAVVAAATPAQLARLRELVAEIKLVTATVVGSTTVAEESPNAAVIEHRSASDSPPSTAPADPTVRFLKDGQIVEEPRSARPWSRIEDLL